VLQPLGVVPVVRSSSDDALDSQFPVASNVTHDASPFIPVLRNLSSTTNQCTTVALPICYANSSFCPSVRIRFRYEIYG